MKTSSISFAAAIVVPVLLFLLAPVWNELFVDVKKVNYQVISKRKIGGEVLQRAEWPGIKVVYDDGEVVDGTFISLLVVNSGEAPVTSGDFDRPLQVITEPPGAITSFRVADSFPQSLPVEVENKQGIISVSPLLLNVNDYFVLELFGLNDFDVVGISSRIAGIAEVAERKAEAASGLYIKYVSEVDHGRTLEKRVGRLNVMPLFAASFLLILSAGALLSLRELPIKAGWQVVVILLACAAYFAGIYCFRLVQQGAGDLLARWAELTIYIAYMACALSAAFWLRARLARSLRELVLRSVVS